MKRKWFVVLCLCFLVVVLVVAPDVFPEQSSLVADGVRLVAGPEVVAELEQASFSMQDWLKMKSPIDDSEPGITVVVAPTVQPTPTLSVASEVLVEKTAVFAEPETIEVLNVVSDLPQIGWVAYSLIEGEPVMAQTTVELDPDRPHAAIVLVRMDLSKLNLRVIPGFLEPSSSMAIQKEIPDLGVLPEADLRYLVAAFNGGFKTVNGQFGMMVDGVELLPPKEGLATIIFYRDGTVQIRQWTSDLWTDEVLSFRQNCPPILIDGQITKQVYQDDREIWGQTIENTSITWRTGLGLSQDGRYLIYAVGNATSVENLAKALQRAGAYNAMQLDINKHYARFATFGVNASGERVAIKLLDQMEDDSSIFLVPRSRDFFYLTVK